MWKIETENGEKKVALEKTKCYRDGEKHFEKKQIVKPVWTKNSSNGISGRGTGLATGYLETDRRINCKTLKQTLNHLSWKTQFILHSQFLQ